MLSTQKFLVRCRRVGLCLLGVLLAGCAQPDRPSLSGQTGFNEQISVGRHQVPLPEGEWRLVAYQVSRSPEGAPFVDLQLLKIDESARELQAGVLISANLVASEQPMPQESDALCRQPGYFHGGVGSSVNGGKDCWLVSYFKAAMGRQSDQLTAKTLAYLHQHRIRYPNFALFSAYRLSSEQDSLTVHYYFNPEYGRAFTAAPSVSWPDSPWHPDHYRADPQRVAYVEALKAWGGDWYERVKLGFAMN